MFFLNGGLGRLPAEHTHTFSTAATGSELGDMKEKELARERALLGIIHNGGSRAAPAHGLRINTLRSA
jgi:hypothetical protein